MEDALMMTVFERAGLVEKRLALGGFACPVAGCDGRLRRWGYAGSRVIEADQKLSQPRGVFGCAGLGSWSWLVGQEPGACVAWGLVGGCAWGGAGGGWCLVEGALFEVAGAPGSRAGHTAGTLSGLAGHTAGSRGVISTFQPRRRSVSRARAWARRFCPAVARAVYQSEPFSM